MIAATAAALALKPEPRDARMLVASRGAIVAIAPDSTRTPLLPDAQDAAYSPDGTMIAFARSGDLWDANADGTGQRRLMSTPSVEEWGPSWSPDGHALVYSAKVDGRRQIRIVQLPTAPSVRVAPSNGEEWSPTFSSTGRLAFVSTRGGTPAIYVAGADGKSVAAFDTTTPTVPPADVRDLDWSPDGKRIAYTSEAADGTTSLIVDDGTTQVDLTTTPAADEHPVWSPTGTRIAYDDGDDNLRSIAADGTDLRELGEGRPLQWEEVPIGKPVFPNLVQRPPSGLVVTPGADGRWLLGFTSMVDNRGPGVLRIQGTRHGRSTVMNVRQFVTLEGGERVSCPSRASCTTRSPRPTTTGTSSASTAMSCGARAPTSCSCAITRAGSASRITTASRRAFRTARRASSRTAHSSIRAHASSRRARPSATPTGIRRTSTARTSTSARSPPATTGSCTA